MSVWLCVCLSDISSHYKALTSLSRRHAPRYVKQNLDSAYHNNETTSKMEKLHVGKKERKKKGKTLPYQVKCIACIDKSKHNKYGSHYRPCYFYTTKHYAIEMTIITSNGFCSDFFPHPRIRYLMTCLKHCVHVFFTCLCWNAHPVREAIWNLENQKDNLTVKHR